MPDATTLTPRQRLIDAAADLFYRQGIGAVGVDLVSKAAGVSKRTLYREFGSKDQLIAQSLDAKGPEIIGAYLPAEDGDAPPRQQILAAFDRLSWWTASESYRGCPFVNTATELADALHPARDVARDYTLRIRAFFERQAAHRPGAGSQPPGQPADRLLRRRHRAGSHGQRARSRCHCGRGPGTARRAGHAVAYKQVSG